MRVQFKLFVAAALCLMADPSFGAPSSMLHTMPKASSDEASGGGGNWLTKWFHHKDPADGSGATPAGAQPTPPVAYMPPSDAASPRVAMNSAWGASNAAVAVATPITGNAGPGGARAASDANRAAEEPSNDCKALRERGHAKDREGDLAGAERLYRRAIAADPTSAAAVNDLGLCLARQGQLEPSSAVLRQAILMRPDKPLYRNNLATVLVELGRPDEAVAQLKSVNNEATAHYNVGQLLMRSQKTEAALAQFRKSIEAEPGFGPAQEALAQLQPAANFAAIAASNVAANAANGMSLKTAATVANIGSTGPAGALPPTADITPEIAEAPQPVETPLSGAPTFPRLLPPVMSP